jgi:Tol biopolymer transport system component
MQADFSPDGSQVAFVWNGEKEDNFDIYVKLLGSDALLRITSDPAPDFSPAWSPDGGSIAYLRQISATRQGVFLTPAIGGPEQKLTEVDCCQFLMEAGNLAVAEREMAGDSGQDFAPRETQHTSSVPGRRRKATAHVTRRATEIPYSRLTAPRIVIYSEKRECQ